MTDDSNRADGGFEPEPTPDECIRAGMYWFGRSDFVAAEAWWRRAVEIDPDNGRALECLRLLEKTSSTGFKSGTDNPFSTPTARRNPTFPPESPIDHELVDSEAPTPSDALKAPVVPEWRDTSANNPDAFSTDPFDFVEKGEELYRTPSGLHAIPAQGAPRNPWDEGPSRTSVVTVQSSFSGDFDAVPDPTPLPELDRERFFNRGDPQSREEIVDFLRATGDLPMDVLPEAAPGVPPQDILFDDPIELEPAEAATVAIPAAPRQPLAPERAPARKNPAELLEAARDRFQLHDFAGALDLLEQIPPEGPGGEEAKGLAAEARHHLLKMYESKIGDFERAPRVLISGEEVIWLNLNHRAGFILSQIDGAVTYEDLIALSGMPRLDTVRILADLLQDKVIG